MNDVKNKRGVFPLWPDGVPDSLGGEGPEHNPTLTFYRPDNGERLPCIVLCPGGGYNHISIREGEPVALWLNSIGVACALLHYRLSPYRHPVPLNDAKRAMRTVRARAGEWNLDPARIGILGFSAGGHLAVSVSTMFDAGDPNHEDPVERESCRPDVLVCAYAPISYEKFGHLKSMEALLADEHGKVDEKLRTHISLENHVSPDMPPTFLWYTSEDSAVNVENSLLLATKLHQHGVPFALHVFTDDQHGLGLANHVPNVAQWKDLCAAWLTDRGFLKK